MNRMDGSSKAARWAGEFIHMEPIEALLPIAEFWRRAGPMTKWPSPREDCWALFMAAQLVRFWSHPTAPRPCWARVAFNQLRNPYGSPEPCAGCAYCAYAGWAYWTCAGWAYWTCAGGA